MSIPFTFIPFDAGDDAVVGTDLCAELIAPEAIEIVEAFAYSKFPPTGADAIFDINVNGTSIWNITQANRIRIAAGANEATPVSSFDTVTVAKNANITIDMDQIGSTFAGQSYSVFLHTRPTAPALYGPLDCQTNNLTNVGTINGRDPTADGLVLDKKTLPLNILDWTTAITTGDGKVYRRIPDDLDGKTLTAIEAQLGAAQSTSGTVSIQIARLRAATAGGARAVVDMLSTNLTIDVNEWDSKDATTPAVINTSNDDVLEGDMIRVDIDGAGTGAQGLYLDLGFA